MDYLDLLGGGGGGPNGFDFFFVVGGEVPGEWGVGGTVFEDGVLNFDAWGLGGGEAGEDQALLFVARQLAGIANIEHGGNGRIGLEGPAAPRQWRRFGSGRGGANFDDEHAADGIAVGGESLVKPGEQSGHAVVVGVAAVHGVDLSAGNVGTRGGRNVRKSGGEAGGGDEGNVMRGELGELGVAQAGASDGGREIGGAEEKALAAFDDGGVEDDGGAPALENAIAPFGERTLEAVFAVGQFAGEGGFESRAAVQTAEDWNEDAKEIRVDEAPGDVVEAGSFGLGDGGFESGRVGRKAGAVLVIFADEIHGADAAAGNGADEADGVAEDARSGGKISASGFFEAGEDAGGPGGGFDAATTGGDDDDGRAGLAGANDLGGGNVGRHLGGGHVEVVVSEMDVRGEDGETEEGEQQREAEAVEDESDGGQSPAKNHEEDEEVGEGGDDGGIAELKKFAEADGDVKAEAKEEGPEGHVMAFVRGGVVFLETGTEGREEFGDEFGVGPGAAFELSAGDEQGSGERGAGERAERKARIVGGAAGFGDVDGDADDRRGEECEDGRVSEARRQLSEGGGTQRKRTNVETHRAVEENLPGGDHDGPTGEEGGESDEDHTERGDVKNAEK